MGRSIVSKQEAHVCDLENKLEFQRGQVKRFEVRTGDSFKHSANDHVKFFIVLFVFLFLPVCPISGAGIAFKGQRGSSGRGAGAERPGRSSGERERPLLSAASAGNESGDGGADTEGAGQQPQTHGPGNKPQKSAGSVQEVSLTSWKLLCMLNDVKNAIDNIIVIFGPFCVTYNDNIIIY